MMRKKQSMLTVLLLGVFLFGFAVWGILKPADAQSQSEAAKPCAVSGVLAFFVCKRKMDGQL